MRKRNYDKLLGTDSEEYLRDNYRDLLSRSLKSNDLYDRDVVRMSIDHPDLYSKQTIDRKWKEVTHSSEVEDIDYSDCFLYLKRIELSEFLRSIRNQTDYHVTSMFILLVTNNYDILTDEVKSEVKDMAKSLHKEITDFQELKVGNMERISSISTSYTKFLSKKLQIPPAYVRRYINDFINKFHEVFNDENDL